MIHLFANFAPSTRISVAFKNFFSYFSDFVLLLQEK